MASNIITPSFDPVIFPGFSESGSYDAHRPSYHPPAVAYLLTSLGVVGKHGATVIDMGAGTGKFTEILASREEEFEIIAVEPHEDMRQVLVAKKLPRTLVMEESVYTVWSRKQYPGALELEGCAQAVVVAQAFHWFATESALCSLHRFLAPGGTLGLIWNVEDYNQSASYTCATYWETLLRNVLVQYQDGLPRYRDRKWDGVWELDGVRELFAATTTTTTTTNTNTNTEGEVKKTTEQRVFRVMVDIGKEDLWKRICTLSYVQGVRGLLGEMENLRAKFDMILDKEESVVRNEKGEIQMHYSVHVVWTRGIAGGTRTRTGTGTGSSPGPEK